MARNLRIEMAGGVFHIYSRGNRQASIFNDERDRRFWLGLLGQVCKKYRWICHSYCMMDNHYHLIIETPELTLSSGMRQLNGVYTQKFNWWYGLVGHLFQGRFKSVLVEKDTYLLELSRYVLLNPVRAELALSVTEWPWSSYPYIIGTAKAPDWYCPEWILRMFSEDIERARKLFIEFVLEGIHQPSVWKHLKAGIILGSHSFAVESVDRFVQ